MTLTQTLLEGKRVLIIGGGGGGIGRAITNTIAQAGATLAVVDVDEERAQAAAKEAAEHGASALGISGDIRQGDDIERMVSEARDGLGGIDTLITVVGGLMAWRIPFHRLHEVADDEWDLIFDLNIRYVFRVLRPVLAIMLDQGTGGSIVSVGSDAGTAGHGSPNTAAYGAAKSGLFHLAKTIATEYGPDGIRMNIVSPGPTKTLATDDMAPHIIEAMNATIPLGHRGDPQDIADAVFFFASPMSAHVSGQLIGVDGGLSVQRPMPDFSKLYKS
ncbi:MAG TPA: SDR family oxidoreductase [Acidimicrobiales bacterium]|jgi:3-oxoacyl-[acyl-carrier protein] reductase|nr:SDR family oxidoreductase [Acidimicrobiales bacterium]